MGKKGMYKIDTEASPSMLEIPGTNDFVSGLFLFCLIPYYIINILFHKSQCI